ncbi:MAG: ankyrin repeat domain-containing protein [Gammaproteobacteria bacterium]|nr:ankyrin repeat domain-containing protein [Gammaproteobacteria bacterium]
MQVSVALLAVLAPLAVAAADWSLLEAARDGNTAAVARLVEDSVDVDTAAADGTTALHWAAHRDDLQMAKLLLAAQADAGPANEYGVTPLHLACLNRDGEMAEILLAAGADAAAATWSGESVLMKCAKTGATHAVEALLGAGADPNAREKKQQQTALMWAAAGGHAEVTRLLVKNAADIAARSKGGFTPLLYAARSGDLETAQFLLDAGAEPNEMTAAHGNALVVAAASGHEPLSLLLLRRGADPESADAYGTTALHYAVANGLAALNGVRYDPVYRVLPENMHQLALALLEAGADPDVQIETSHRLGPDGSPFSMQGATPFLLAAISADVELMQLFKKHGADQNIVAEGGTTALMAAARAACTGDCAFKGGNKANDEDIERAFRAVRTVIEMGIDANAKNEDGQTAMHMAAFTGADPVVRYLAENGADINVMDNYGETPWSMASGISPVLRYRGLYGYHQSTAALLKQLGATTTSRDAMDSNAPPPPGQ